MPSAATLNIAGDVAPSNANYVQQHATASLRTALIAYRAAILAALPNPTTPQRTVTNWTRRIDEVVNDLPTVKANETPAMANRVGVLVNRIARAVEWAVSQGRLTAGQGVTLLANYNSAWFPP